MLRNPVVIGIDQVLVHMQMNLVNRNNDTLQDTFVQSGIVMGACLKISTSSKRFQQHWVEIIF